jgi:hypothetical protein
MAGAADGDAPKRTWSGMLVVLRDHAYDRDLSGPAAWSGAVDEAADWHGIGHEEAREALTNLFQLQPGRDLAEYLAGSLPAHLETQFFAALVGATLVEEDLQ